MENDALTAATAAAIAELSATPAKLDLHLVRRSTVDVLEQALALPFWQQDYTQLSKGSFSGSVLSVTCEGLQIFTESMTQAVDQIASAPQDCYVIGLPTVIEGDATWGLLPINKHSLITLGKNAELYFKTANVSEITAAVIPSKRLEEYAANIEWIDLVDSIRTIKPVEPLNPGVANQLLATLGKGLKFHLEKHEEIYFPEMWKSYEDDLLSTCLFALLHVKGNTSAQSDQRIPRYLVNKVREETLMNPGVPLTIDDLCLILRVKRRTLNHAFARVLGITPITYMRNVKLHRIRDEILNAPNEIISISQLATKWGFWHMSLFSRYYRKLFGEVPIDTLQRSRRLR